MYHSKIFNVMVTSFDDEDGRFGHSYEFENIPRMVSFITDIFEYSQNEMKIEIFKRDIKKEA